MAEINTFEDTGDLKSQVKHLYRELWGHEIEYLENHLSYDGWLGFVGEIEGNVIGFIWGYTSAPGQWFHDRAKENLTAEIYHTWVRDSFELAEFGIKEEYQGQDIGTRLHNALVSDLTDERAVTVTDDGEDGAQQFYEKHGWEVVDEAVTFTGSQKRLLGLEIP